jgi:hypothetical protein
MISHFFTAPGLGWLPIHISMQSERTEKRVLTERAIPVAPLRPTGTSPLAHCVPGGRLVKRQWTCNRYIL